jgi:NADPH:quinone reductase-like Zn-dependent oxidoreductase
MGKDIVAEGRIKLGDRVCGACDGMEALRPQSGAFAEYASVDGIMALKMPDGMSFEVGAGMPLRIATSVMAIFHSLQLPMELLHKPAEQPFPILVYGGATSTGTFAIQLLKRMGARVITTCSPHSNDLVRSYGADDIFDYHEATCGEDIRALTKNALEYALDCITEENTMKICYQALGRCGGKCTFRTLRLEISY